MRFVRLAAVCATATIMSITLAACAGRTDDSANGGIHTPSAAPSGGVADGVGVGSGGAANAAASSASPSAAGHAMSTGGSARSTSTSTAAKFPSGRPEVVRYAVPIGSYQALFNQATAANYRPVFLAGYAAGGHTYMNVVFQPANGIAWYEYSEMSASGYQARFDALKSQGYRLVFVNSYVNDGQIRYAGIWTKSSGPDYFAFHGYSQSTYQSTFDSKSKAGYTPVAVTVAATGSAPTYSGLFTKASLGSWVLRSGLSPADYDELFTSSTKAGMQPLYLNAYSVGGEPKFVALFSSVRKGAYYGYYGLTASQLASKIATLEKAGFRTGSVAGYETGGQVRFLANWYKA